MAQGYSRRELADALHVSEAEIAGWEDGRSIPAGETLAALAAALHVEAGAVLRGGVPLSMTPARAPQEQEKKKPSWQTLFVTHTSLSRGNERLCAKACWRAWGVRAQLFYLFAGILLFALAGAGAGLARYTSVRVPQALVPLCAAAGAACLVLTAEGYRLRMRRNSRRTEETEPSAATFTHDGFTVERRGLSKSWQYSHVTGILETGRFFILRCGREVSFMEKRSLPAGQETLLAAFLRESCENAEYRTLSGSGVRRTAGLLLSAAALLLLLTQAGYLAAHARYGLVYRSEWIRVAVNAGILGSVSGAFLLLAGPRRRLKTAVGVLCGILLFADLISGSAASVKTEEILSRSPGGANELVLKRDPATGKTMQYRYPLLWFVRPYESFPYTVYGSPKLQWLTGDVCAVTYLAEQGGPAHQYVATFGSRGRTSHYYVEAALDGTWEPSGKNTAGWRLVRDTGGIVLSNGSGEERYAASDCVQFGATAIALCRNGLPRWTVALNEDCRIDPKTLLVSYGGTLTVCRVSMNPTAPMVFRSTDKAPGAASQEPPQETAEKYDQRIKDGALFFTWDYGHRWTKVPLPAGALNELIAQGGDALPEGSFHIAADAGYLVCGRSPLSVLFTSDQGKTWKTYKVADIEDGISSRFVCYTSLQTACVAIGAGRTMGQEGTALYYTQDGGLSWKTRGAPPSTALLTGMNFLSQDVGYLSYGTLGGEGGKFYKTEDGGRSFTKVKLPEGTLQDSHGLTFGKVYDTPQVPRMENGVPVLYVTQGGDGDFEGGRLRARYELKDGGKTWAYVSQEEPPQEKAEG